MRDGSRGPGGNPAAGPGFPGGWPERGTPLLAYAAALAAMLKLSVDRRSLTAADRAVVLACAITAMALACPLISGEYRQRLLLMSPVPAAIACAFVLARLSINTTGGRAWRTAVPSAIVGMLCLVSLAHGFRTPHPPILTPESLAELKELRGEIDDPARTLVVARHGLEWWAAHALNTPVRMGRVPEDAFEKYERVLIVQDVRPPMGPRREGRGGGPGGFGPPPMGDAGPDDGGDAGGMPRLPAGADWGPDDDVRMPPPRRMRDPDGGPGPRRGPLGGRGPGPGGGGPGGPGMMSIRVPPGSRLIHEGEWYRVFEVPRTSAE